MGTLVATNIRLPENLLKSLRYRVIDEKKSVNQLIREAIEQLLKSSGPPDSRVKDPFDDVIGSAKSGIRDGSLHYDHYL